MPTIDQLPIELIESDDQIISCRLLPRACVDCGRMCDELRTVTINYVKRPARYRREKCNTCKYWLNHATGAYDLDVHQFNRQMDREIREKDK